jgi:phosphopantothenoylcysteine decarboxylase/phosphopantothenate--cysteine ligase
VREPNPAKRPPTVASGDLSGRRIVITAGGTEEAIDPVRILANRSSGRQGIALAEAARDRGADVVLIAARVAVPLPEGVEIVRAMSVAALEAALASALPAFPAQPAQGTASAARATGADALIAAAAVSDFRPVGGAATEKLRRDGELVLRLESTPDLLAGVARRLGPRATRHTILVGFSAESGGTTRAAEKLASKDLDLVVANDVTAPGVGFESLDNAAVITGADGTTTSVGPAPKRVVADAILDRVAALFAARQ